MAQIITQKHIAKSLSYEQYRALIDDLLKENRTTGKDQSAAMVAYTTLNVKRMNRIEKQVVITADSERLLKLAGRRMIWLVVGEAWCGDVAQNLPVMAKMASYSPRIDVKILLRDENPEIIDHYLTNGGRAIPKLIVLEADSLTELGTWGPRPAPAQAMMEEYKANPVEPKEEVVKRIQLWYARDKGKTLQEELRKFLE